VCCARAAFCFLRSGDRRFVGPCARMWRSRALNHVSDTRHRQAMGACAPHRGRSPRAGLTPPARTRFGLALSRLVHAAPSQANLLDRPWLASRRPASYYVVVYTRLPESGRGPQTSVLVRCCRRSPSARRATLRDRERRRPALCCFRRFVLSRDASATSVLSPASWGGTTRARPSDVAVVRGEAVNAQADRGYIIRPRRRHSGAVRGGNVRRCLYLVAAPPPRGLFLWLALRLLRAPFSLFREQYV